MKRNLRIKLVVCIIVQFVIASLSLSAWTADNGDGTFTNPVLNSDYPDCDVIRVGDDYYYVSSSFHFVPGDPILRSEDLVNWEVVGYPIPRYEGTENDARFNLEGGGAYGRGSWAPSIRYHDGTFYVCYWIRAFDERALGRKGDFYVSRATNPAGPWTINKIGESLYDPGLFFDDDGRVYVVHGQGRIYCTELTSDLKVVKSPGKLIIDRSRYSIDGALEGSHVYKINGMYFVLCPTGDKQHAFRSKSLFGPYEHRVILSSFANWAGKFGLHQGGIVETQTGEWWAMIFQDRGNYGRCPSLEPVTWTDGWPIMGDNTKGVITFRKPNVGKDYPPTPMKLSDEFESSALGLQWQWNHNPDDAAWSLTERPGFLRLKTSKVTDFWRNARNTLTQRMFAPQSRAITKLDVSAMKDGDIAGFGVFQVNSSYIGVSQTNGVRSLVVNTEALDKRTRQWHLVRTTVASTPLTENTVWLKAEVPNLENTVQYSYSLDGETWTPLADKQLTGGTGDWMAIRYAVFNFATQTPGGHVDFDWFHHDFPGENGNLFVAGQQIDAERYDDNANCRTAFCQDELRNSYDQAVVTTNATGWLKFNRVNCDQGVNKFEARVATSAAGGFIEVRSGQPEGKLLGTLRVAATGGADHFVTQSCIIKELSGVQSICLLPHPKPGESLNLNWFRLVRLSVPRENHDKN